MEARGKQNDVLKVLETGEMSKQNSIFKKYPSEMKTK